MNTDKALKGNPSLAGGEGVIRDSTGSWITRFTVNLGYCSSILVEL